VLNKRFDEEVTSMARTSLAVVLAAGDATRMKSSKSKVLHTVGNLPLIAHVTRAAAAAGVNKIALVVGRDAERVTEAAGAGLDVPMSAVEQTERKGTGHAVLMAETSSLKAMTTSSCFMEMRR
jgi:bifunctional UDP-N-acetylglucosamine pyrophosphorylase/glucosamine-1-phosphate N-acetyltransferase